MKTSSKAMFTKTLIAVALCSLAGSAMAAGAGDGFVNPADMKWGPAPPSIPKGAKLTVLQGNPGAAGPFVIRLSVPAGYKIPPHWHSQEASR
jgi:hypothetical protein